MGEAPAAAFVGSGLGAGASPACASVTVMLVAGAVTVGVDDDDELDAAEVRLAKTAAKSRGVNRAIGRRNNAANFRQVRVVKHEASRRSAADAIQNSVGLAACQQASVAIERQRGDVRLAGLVINIAPARGGNPIDLALLPGGDVQRAVGRESQRPNIALAGRKVFRGACRFRCDRPCRRATCPA